MTVNKTFLEFALLPLSVIIVAVMQSTMKRAGGHLHPALCLLIYEAALLHCRSSRSDPSESYGVQLGLPRGRMSSLSLTSPLFQHRAESLFCTVGASSASSASSLSPWQAASELHDGEWLSDGQAPASFCPPTMGLKTGQQRTSPDVFWEVSNKERPTMASLLASAHVGCSFRATKQVWNRGIWTVSSQTFGQKCPLSQQRDER